MQTDRTPNRLVHESSPYLLQHAYNPVDWYAWGEEALTKARREDKPIILSIGYSACHWCHVMERESFEHEGIGAFMSEHFVCIKVDREERPDVDQVYMDAVHAMGLQGGWPLNVFLMPDARPFYGGTYFPAQQWGGLIQQIVRAFQDNRKQLEESAEGFREVLNQSEIEKYGIGQGNTTFVREQLANMFAKLERQFDSERGGMGNAPKFPMPSIYLFLLRYYQLTQDEKALAQVNQTLQAMAAGGIYDQVGGGFARYSVDAEWFAPHFEKMLYDNGQLLSLYAEAYALTQNDTYKGVLLQTVEFVKRELTSPEGGFYSALDADSEGIEGKFYVWTWEEFAQATQGDRLAAAYYNLSEEGNWEHDFNILYRSMTDEAFAEQHQIPLEKLKDHIKQWQESLLAARSQRVRPSLDDKILCGWNALMLKGLVDAYAALGIPELLDLALANAAFLKEKMTQDERLFRNYKQGKASIPAYLEDYALTIQAYIALYQVCFEERWLIEANRLTQYVLKNFYHEEEALFFYTDATGERLIARKKEIFDNVISASNSVMATNLYWLSLLWDNRAYRAIAEAMLAKINVLLQKEVRYLANWASLYTYVLAPTVEIAISGEKLDSFAQAMHRTYLPNKVVVGTKTKSTLPLLEMRDAKEGQTLIYVCQNKACLRPTDSVEEAWKQITGFGRLQQ